MTFFDRVMVVDWSASARPTLGPDSIWVGTWSPDGGSTPPVNLPTRHAAVAHLVESCPARGRMLVGFDFPLGYPSGFAAAAGLDGTPWRAIWQHLAESLHDAPDNANDRWRVATDLNRQLGERWFWGAPPSAANEWLPTTKPALHGAVAELRQTEIRLRERGLRPFSARQLLGAGSVGSQAITGIPAVERLRHHPELRGRVRVWPFETGLTDRPADDIADAIVVAEVWPSAIDFSHIDHPVKDARQVTALAAHLGMLDANGVLSTMFAPASAVAERSTVEREEGWVLTVE